MESIFTSEIEELVCSMKERRARVVRTYIDNKPCTKLIANEQGLQIFGADRTAHKAALPRIYQYAVPQRIETAKALFDKFGQNGLP